MASGVGPHHPSLPRAGEPSTDFGLVFMGEAFPLFTRGNPSRLGRTSLGHIYSRQNHRGRREKLRRSGQGWRRAPGLERERDCGPRRVRAAGVFAQARRFSSTGRKIGRSSAASGPNCRSLTSSFPTAAPSFSSPIPSRPTRCCATPTTTPSASWGGVPRRGIYDNLWTSPAQGDPLASAAGMHESIRPVAGQFTPLALMGVRCSGLIT
jgi:hypothetical protein